MADNNYIPRHSRTDRTGKEASSMSRSTLPEISNIPSADDSAFFAPKSESKRSSSGFLLPTRPLSFFSIVVSVFLLIFLVLITVSDILRLSWLDGLDAALIGMALPLRNDGLTGFFTLYTELGDTLVIAALCFLVLVILALQKNWKKLAFFAIVMITGEIVCYGIKHIVSRVRPSGYNLIVLPDDASFPSGHSFASMLFLILIAMMIYVFILNRGASHVIASVPVVLALLIALLMGFSRIYLGVHWPSDVIAGFLLAFLWLVPALSWYKRKFIRH